MTRRRLITVGVLLGAQVGGLGGFATMSRAQSAPRSEGGLSTNGVSPGVAARVEAARVLVEQGEGEEARALLDSLARVVPARSPDLAEVLYWRGALAERLAEAERDWRRAIRDVPTAPRTPDLLIRIGELEMVRQQPTQAQPHFERVLREYPDHAQRPRVLVWLAMTQVEQQDLPGACRTVASMDSLGLVTQASEIEGVAAIDSVRRRCPAVDAGPATVPGASSTSVMSPTAAHAGSMAATVTDATSPPAALPAALPAAPPSASSDSVISSAGRFSVQVGAYETLQEANDQIAVMKRYGFEARIDGDVPLFRVRVGRFATRREAVALFNRIRTTGITAFVTELSR